jgi:hypothetical protein
LARQGVPKPILGVAWRRPNTAKVLSTYDDGQQEATQWAQRLLRNRLYIFAVISRYDLCTEFLLAPAFLLAREISSVQLLSEISTLGVDGMFIRIRQIIWIQ